MNDYHNPPQQSNSADEAYESDSGEGRLGDPSSILLHGSSRNSVAAGAVARQQSQQLRADGNGSAGVPAGQIPKPKTPAMSDDEGVDMGDDGNAGFYGPERPPHMRAYGNQGGDDWSFDILKEQDNNADADTDMLLGHPTDAEDNDSNAADQGDLPDDFVWDATEDNWNARETSFQIGGDDYEDDHTMYSGAHEQDGIDYMTPGGVSEPDAESQAVDIMLSPDKSGETD